MGRWSRKTRIEVAIDPALVRRAAMVDDEELIRWIDNTFSEMCRLVPLFRHDRDAARLGEIQLLSRAMCALTDELGLRKKTSPVVSARQVRL